jgi:hypothetical protein
MHWCFRGRSYVDTSVVTTRIYRKDPPQVTTSHNRLGLSLSKYIRHRLIAKNKRKRRSRTCEDLGQISVDYSRTRRAPMPIASPRLAPPSPVRGGERAYTCVSHFLLYTTHLQLHREHVCFLVCT